MKLSKNLIICIGCGLLHCTDLSGVPENMKLWNAMTKCVMAHGGIEYNKEKAKLLGLFMLKTPRIRDLLRSVPDDYLGLCNPNVIRGFLYHVLVQKLNKQANRTRKRARTLEDFDDPSRIRLMQLFNAEPIDTLNRLGLHFYYATDLVMCLVLNKLLTCPEIKVNEKYIDDIARVYHSTQQFILLFQRDPLFRAWNSMRWHSVQICLLEQGQMITSKAMQIFTDEVQNACYPTKLLYRFLINNPELYDELVLKINYQPGDSKFKLYNSLTLLKNGTAVLSIIDQLGALPWNASHEPLMLAEFMIQTGNFGLLLALGGGGNYARSAYQDLLNLNPQIQKQVKLAKFATNYLSEYMQDKSPNYDDFELLYGIMYECMWEMLHKEFRERIGPDYSERGFLDKLKLELDLQLPRYTGLSMSAQDVEINPLKDLLFTGLSMPFQLPAPAIPLDEDDSSAG